MSAVNRGKSVVYLNCI